MFMKIQILTLPSWVTGSKLSASTAFEKVKVTPAAPTGAAEAAAVGEAGAAPAAPAPVVAVERTLVAAAFWLTVTGACVGAAAAVVGAGALLAAGAGVLVAP